MVYLVNGEMDDRISVTDRGFQYGDGLFETIALSEGKLAFWWRHMARLLAGCQRLGIAAPAPDLLLAEARQLCVHQDTGVLKIIISRASGGRGYQCAVPSPANRVIALHPCPDYPPDFSNRGINVRICQTRLGINPALAGLKHLNRLEQVLARQEWRDAGTTEGIMLDCHGNAIEGVMTNLFLVRDGQLWTPDLSNCGVTGIMREVVIEVAEAIDIPVNIGVIPESELYQAEAIFLTNAIAGLWPVKRLGQQTMGRSRISQRLNAGLHDKRREEALDVL